MSLLLTASVLFLFTLLVPAFASADSEVEALTKKVDRLRALKQVLEEEHATLSAGNLTLKERNRLRQEGLQNANALALAEAELNQATAQGTEEKK